MFLRKEEEKILKAHQMDGYFRKYFVAMKIYVNMNFTYQKPRWDNEK